MSSGWVELGVTGAEGVGNSVVGKLQAKMEKDMVSRADSQRKR